MLLRGASSVAREANLCGQALCIKNMGLSVEFVVCDLSCDAITYLDSTTFASRSLQGETVFRFQLNTIPIASGEVSLYFFLIFFRPSRNLLIIITLSFFLIGAFATTSNIVVIAVQTSFFNVDF